MNLIKQGGVYHARLRKRGKPGWHKITTHKTTRAEANKVVADANLVEIERAAIAGNLTQEAIGRLTAGQKITVNTCLKPFEDYLRSIASSERTIAAYLGVLRCWIADCKIGALNPMSVTSNVVSEWINNPKGHSKLSSRQYKLTVVRVFYDFMVAKGWSYVNPAALVRVDLSILSHEQKESAVKAPFAPEEVEALLQATDDPFWRFATVCSHEYGLRLGDICDLEWRCFAYPGKLIVWTTKGDKRVEFDVTPAVSKLIQQVPAIDGRYVFPEQHAINTDLKKRALLSMQFKRLCLKAKIEGKSFHNLRHTAATDTANAETNEIMEIVNEIGIQKARKLLGHKSAKTTRGYVH